MLSHESTQTLILIEDFEVLSLADQQHALTDADALRREKDEQELYDLIRMNNDGRSY